ncbi:MAG: Fe-S cluster assembly protein SufD, partial [Micrococcales bacterium]|nr:Fe-S cluster assembly protein SufD [Micrococcales bacterium]
MSQHGLSEHSHGSFVPLQIRSERPKSTSVSDFPAIDSRQDLWRYLSVEQLRGLDADVLAEYENEIKFASAAGVKVSWIPSTDALVG